MGHREQAIVRDPNEALAILLTKATTTSIVPDGDNPRFLMILYGPPCAGKTTVGLRLASEFGASRIAMDHVRTLLIDDEGETAALSPAMFDVLSKYAEYTLARGSSVVCEGAFAATGRRLRLRAIGGQFDRPVITIRFVTNVEDLVTRLEKRRKSQADAEGLRSNVVSIERLLWFADLYHPPLFEALPGEVVLNTSEVTPEGAYDAVVSAIAHASAEP